MPAWAKSEKAATMHELDQLADSYIAESGSKLFTIPPDNERHV